MHGFPISYNHLKWASNHSATLNGIPAPQISWVLLVKSSIFLVEKSLFCWFHRVESHNPQVSCPNPPIFGWLWMVQSVQSPFKWWIGPDLGTANDQLGIALARGSWYTAEAGAEAGFVHCAPGFVWDLFGFFVGIFEMWLRKCRESSIHWLQHVSPV